MNLGEAFGAGGDSDKCDDCAIKAKIYAISNLPQQGIWILELKPEKPVPYQAGQYIDIAFGGLEPRSYSLAEAPSADGILLVHIKRGPGAVSDHMWRTAKVNDTVRVSTAKGVNVYDPADRRPILAIAGGAGFTPLKAIIDEALRSNPAQPVYFFWGTKTAEDQYYKPYFENLQRAHPNFHFIPVVGGNVGDEAARQFDDLSGFKIHVCGPPPMVSNTIGAVLAKGARRDSVWYEGKQSESGASPAPAPGPL